MLNTHIKHTITDAESQTHALWMEAIISVSFLASCSFLAIHEMRLQTALHYLYLHRHRGDSLSLNAWMTPGALESFHVAGAVLESVHKSDQINSRQRLTEVPVTNRFLIWFEWDKNSWIKSSWRKKKREREAQFILGTFVFCPSEKIW